MKRWWGRISNDPLFLQHFNGWATVFWFWNFPLVIGLYSFLPDVWQQVSLLYLAVVSVYANFVGHISAWQSSRVEVRQRDQQAFKSPRSFPDKLPGTRKKPKL